MKAFDELNFKADVSYTKTHEWAKKNGNIVVVGVDDYAQGALGDIVYVVYGMALELGIPLAEVLAEIQASNLSKLGSDGKPVYREDGKVLKGPDYFPPDIPKALGL